MLLNPRLDGNAEHAKSTSHSTPHTPTCSSICSTAPRLLKFHPERQTVPRFQCLVRGTILDDYDAIVSSGHMHLVTPNTRTAANIHAYPLLRAYICKYHVCHSIMLAKVKTVPAQIFLYTLKRAALFRSQVTDSEWLPRLRLL
jgi:hypothetical protein